MTFRTSASTFRRPRCVLYIAHVRKHSNLSVNYSVTVHYLCTLTGLSDPSGESEQISGDAAARGQRSLRRVLHSRVRPRVDTRPPHERERRPGTAAGGSREPDGAAEQAEAVSRATTRRDQRKSRGGDAHAHEAAVGQPQPAGSWTRAIRYLYFGLLYGDVRQAELDQLHDQCEEEMESREEMQRALSKAHTEAQVKYSNIRLVLC